MSYKVKIIGDLKNQQKTWDLVHFLCIQHGMREENADVFAIAVGEAYGNGLQYSPDNYSELIMEFQTETIVAEIENVGDEINFEEIEKFNKNQDFQQYKDGKLGIPMIKALVDDVLFTRKNGKNKIVLSKIIKSNKNVLKGENNEN